MRVPLVLGLVLAAATLHGYDWPASDMQVVRSFGQRGASGVLAGVEVQTLSPVLTAPEDGSLLFLFQPSSQGVQNLPSGLGGFVGLAHDNNLRTVVGHLRSVPGEAKKVYQRGEPLGQAEVQTGASESRHRLFVFDQQLGEVVNPLLVYPALADARPPVIYDVSLVPEGKTEPISLFSKSTLEVGYGTLQVTTADPFTYVPGAGKEKGTEGQRGIYSLEAYLNGTEVFNLTLDSLLEKNGRWLVKGMTAPLDSSLTPEQVWSLGQVFLNQGTNILEIVVKDYAGNQAGRTFRVLGVRP